MAGVDEAEVQEVFKLFDQDGSGIKLREIGTVMRSLGVATTEAQNREFVAEAQKKDKNYIQFRDFLEFVKIAHSKASSESIDVVKELEGMKVGCLHFFDKLSAKQLRESPPDMVKIADVKHMLSSVGEKMSEEEIEELAREIRATCQVEDGRVKFSDLASMMASA
eukprot:TRINITY_DN37318_c0_g1_i1.p2 TRINITY_DN37318_c0_g1~~TRINITY_DN37318_c0_g1_i1.p2  ORF type:complete len:190 (-),score=61.59 TRINITY_DN37318_c0_g1_i1:52-546(-)